MEIINVGLYGGKGIFGGKETPLEASIISCDRHQNCSYFQNQQCLKVRSIGGGTCQFGRVNTVRGYTSRAKKYRDFKNDWENHEQYGKLKSPPQKLGLIDGFVVFPYPYVNIELEDNGELKINGPMMFGRDRSAFIPLDKFTPEFINRVCSFRPQAMMGGEITDYREKIVPTFISHLKEVLPEKYDELVNSYEGYAKKIDYVGRKALLRTIKPSFVHYKSKQYPQFNEEWYWDGEYLIFKSGYVYEFKVTKDYEVEEIKIKPSDRSTIVITNNDQVTTETVFVD